MLLLVTAGTLAYFLIFKAKTNISVLMLSSNIRGYEDTCGCKSNPLGGIKRRTNFVHQEKAKKHRDFLWLDGGNLLFPSYAVDDSKRAEILASAEKLVTSANRLGLVATAVGTYDLAAGMDRLRRLESMAKFPFLSINIVDTKKGHLQFKPVHTVRFQGKKVAIIGVTASQGFNATAHPGLKIVHPETALERATGGVPKGRFVIALTNLNLNTLKALAPKFPWVGIWVSGEHTFQASHFFTGQQLIAATPYLGQGVALLELMGDLSSMQRWVRQSQTPDPKPGDLPYTFSQVSLSAEFD